MAEKFVSLSPYVAMGNMPSIAVDPDGRDILIVVSGKANAKVKSYSSSSNGKGKDRTYNWSSGKDRPASQQFHTFAMDVYDTGKNSLYKTLPEDMTKVGSFSVARDAWYKKHKHGSEDQYGKNNETPGGFYEILNRSDEPDGSNGPTKGKSRGWLSVNDVGKMWGTVKVDENTTRYGISIHPGTPNGTLGCLSMSSTQFKQLLSIVSKALKNGQKVYLSLGGRKATYNKKRKRWEYVDSDKNESEKQ